MFTSPLGIIPPSSPVSRHKLLKTVPAWVGAAAFCLAVLPGCAQTTATLLSTQSALPISGLSTPQGIALNPLSGILYIADPANNDVLQMAKDGTVSVFPTASLNSPQGVAIGPSNTLYIADTGNSRLVKGNGALTFSNSAINQPTGMTVDAQDNVYVIANPANGTVIEVPNGLLGTLITIPTSGLTNPSSLAIDANGNLFIADTGNGRVVEIPASGGQPASGSQTTVTTTGLSTPTGVAVDLAGNLYISDSSNNNVIEISANGGTQTTVYTSSLSQPQGMVNDSIGNLYIADKGHSRIVYENVQPTRNLGTAPVGGFGDPVILNYSITGYLGSSYVPKLQMAFGKDVSLGSLSCSGGTAPEVCSTSVTLQPAAPGAIADAVNVTDPTNASILTQTPVYGIAQGPLSVFEPGTATVLSVTGLINPAGLAVDRTGNVFIADAGPAQANGSTTPPGDVVELSAAGVQTTIATPGVEAPYGIALDGSGNIYVADYGNPKLFGNVLVIAPSGTTRTLAPSPSNGTLYSDPTDVVADSAGNIFTADYGLSQIIMTQVNGGKLSRPLTSANINTANTAPQISNSYVPPYVQPLTVAVDSADNLYVADTYGSQVVTGPANGATPPKVLLAAGVMINGASLQFPSGIAVDAAGTVYVADSGNNRIVEIPAGGGAPTVLNVVAATLALKNPTSLALDSMGNLYIADTGNARIVKVTRSAQSLTFPSTNDGVASAQQIVSLINAGNQSLTLSALTVTPNFTLGGAATTCTSSTALAGGAQCDLGVEFDPTASGTLTGTVNLTDNNLNAPGNATQIALSGTGAGFAATIALTETPGTTVTFGTAVTVNVTVTGSNGTPSGNISYTIDGLNPQTVALDGTGAAQFTIPGTQPVGSYSVTVSYAGNANYTTATPSQSFTLVVTAQPGPGATTTALSLSPTSTNFGQSVTLTATVTPGSAGTPTGTVSFFNGTTLLGTPVALTGGVATLTTTTLPIGSDVITAQYSGDTNYAGSTSAYEVETVAGAAVTTTALVLSPTSSNLGQNVTLTATVKAAVGSTGAPTGTVSFYYGLTQLGTPVAVAANGTASMATTKLPAGSDVLTAQYSGDTNFNGSLSPEAIETVSGMSFTATLSSTSLTMSPTAASVTDTLTLSSTGGYAGTLQFACAGLPSGATCSFSPASQALTGTSTGIKVTMTIQSSSVASLDRWTPMSPAGNLPGLPMLATAFWMPGWLITALAGSKGKKKSLAAQRARHLLLLLLLLGGVGFMTACGGSSAAAPAPATPPSTPKGNSSAELVITGTNNVSQVIPFTVVVQ